MTWNMRRMVAGLIVLGVVVLGVVTYFGMHRYDEDLEVLDRRERCISIHQSLQPNGADAAETALLAECRSEGWAPAAAR